MSQYCILSVSILIFIYSMPERLLYIMYMLWASSASCVCFSMFRCPESLRPETVRPCLLPCKRDCIVTPYSDWSACPSTCQGGVSLLFQPISYPCWLLLHDSFISRLAYRTEEMPSKKGWSVKEARCERGVSVNKLIISYDLCVHKTCKAACCSHSDRLSCL